MKTAYETIKETYDIDTLREIYEYGCGTGVAHDHIYYRDTVDFFDTFENEIIEYIADTLGGEYNEEIWNRNPCHIVGYKNDTTWSYIELVASQLVDEYEDTTCQELSDSDEYTIDPDGEVVFKCDELSNSTYEEIKELASAPCAPYITHSQRTNQIEELASTPWGEDHLEIVSA